MEQSLKLPLLSEDRFNAPMNNQMQASFDLNLLPCWEEEMDDEIMKSNIYPSSQNQDVVVLGDSNKLCFGEAVTENLKPHLPLDLNIEGVCHDDNGDDISLPYLNAIQMTGDDGFPLLNLNEGPIEFEEEQSTNTEITERIRDDFNTSPTGCKYEVFLSYTRGYTRDKDTAKSFASDLYSSLRKDGISILKDEISQSNIEGSEISIIIFTNHYVSSRRCLEELTKIMEFRKSRDHVLLPIFYGVDKYDVGYQAKRLIPRISSSEDEVSRWRTALSEAGGIYGFDVPDHIESNNESEYIQNIVKSVHYILKMKVSSLATNGIVGGPQVQEVISMLHNHKSKDVVSIMIRGEGGIGKTTLARLIFDHIRYDFESAYFLPNDDKEAWERERTWKKKVLVVVDDADRLEQLHALCGSHEWFGEGSKIIITTEAAYLAEFQVDLEYGMTVLSAHASLELFSREAFKQASPKEEFIDVSRRMVDYAGGLPLAIKVLGSCMYGRSLMEFESASKKIESIGSYTKIDSILRLSYDSLDGHEKEIFISIAAIYIGEDMTDVIQKLDGSGCNASIGIRVLMDRSLVTIDNNNKLRMHDLLQDMGRKIIRESSQNELQNGGHKYEVFLSFRGEDTRATFTLHLYSTLRNAGIVVFKDDVEFPRGNYIKTELLQAIGSSKIAILIFSKKYAGSRWCLEELSLIMKYHKSNDQVVLPVFYDMDPLEIRNQSSSFGEAFKNLIHRISPPEDLVSNWRTNLVKAVSIAGIVVRGCRDESENVKDIVENVCYILDKKNLFVVDHPVGVDDRVQEVIKKLQSCRDQNDVVMVGIWGMGGIGKTIIAKAIYNEIGRTFQSRSYLFRIREVWGQEGGQVCLQNLLLSDICNTTKMKINSIESGKIKLRDRLRHKKALVVLDDVDELAQLNALMGSRDWFGPGSMIIITTRDKSLLLEMDCGVYPLKNLDERESTELFSWHVFRQESPKREFSELCSEMVAYSQGLPLTLEVLGSLLFGRSLIEWESLLEKLRTYLPSPIFKNLKRSFDSLDYNEKEIFLSIVLFYIGEDMNNVIKKLDDRGCYASIGMRVLVDKSLVTIDDDNKLGMHDMLQLMGRQILRETSRKEVQNQGHRYDVFLSFRGEDTRATFTSHLYSALCNAGIIVFKDDVELPTGNHIKTEILKAIGSSKISLIIFSKKYAESKWCLEELSIIMKLHKSNDQVVLPVFYDVVPRDIRNQTSSFGEGFKDLIQRISPPEYQVSEWKTALNDAGSIAGVVVLGSCDEADTVKAIVKDVCDKLDKKDLFVPEHPVGMGNRVQELVTMLQNHQFEDVVMVGLWGIGGIGKTTIATAIYNEIGHTFESRSYLFRIREVWGQEGGQVCLQNQLLSDICKTTNMEISSIESGKITLRNRLRHNKALVVLDDVDELAQLNALIGSRDWFKTGSLIIITTRNKRLLLKMDCCVYPLKNLDERESVELFSWHAFKQESPKEDFKKLSRDIVSYSGGLPLALEVLGSYLFDIKVEEWEKVLKKLKKIPNEEIQKKLKISFDGLDDSEKEIFLDISCFFIGMDRYDVTQILNGCKFFADIGINTLLDRSLITIDEKNKLGMHDLLRDMGREIIRTQSQNELGKRRRIWFHKDARDVLLKDMGTEAIEGLSLNLSQSEKEQLRTEAFKKMKRLRLLNLNNVQLRGDYKFISEDLRWLCWHGFPEKYIPRNFYQQKLVAIDLEWSSLTQVWKEAQLLKKLKILNLSHSHYLVQTPNFSKLPNLEKLILKDCPRLSLIHHSIGLLDKLLLLNLEDCIDLQSLPRNVYRLKCLKTLILSGCMNIEKLEEDIEQMESLTSLIAPTIKQVPFSLVRLKNILHLSICGHEGLSHHVIPSLFRSWMSLAKNPLPLSLTRVGMPSSILWKMLNRIRGLPSTIPSSASKQQNLLLDDGLEIYDSLCATNCMNISRLEDCLGHHLIQIGKSTQVFHTLSEMVSKGLSLTNYSDDCILPSNNYPYWLTFKGEGASVKFKLPPFRGCDHLKEMAICCVYFPSGDLGNKACESCILSLIIINYTKTTTTLLYKEEGKLTCLEEVEKKEVISNLESDDQVEVRAVVRNGFTMKKMVVYLIYNESFDEQMKPSTSGTKHTCEEE